MKTRTMGPKNIRGLGLDLSRSKSTAPSNQDAQIPGALGNSKNADPGTLEIGVEFKLDLRNEDLIVLKELGAGNGGTVSKVMHAATKVIMAKKVIKYSVIESVLPVDADESTGDPRRSQKRGQKTDRPRVAHHA